MSNLDPRPTTSVRAHLAAVTGVVFGGAAVVTMWTGMDRHPPRYCAAAADPRLLDTCPPSLASWPHFVAATLCFAVATVLVLPWLRAWSNARIDHATATTAAAARRRAAKDAARAAYMEALAHADEVFQNETRHPGAARGRSSEQK